MIRGVLALVAALLAACTGGGDSPQAGAAGGRETAASAIVRQLDWLASGQHVRLWGELHPAQQAIVDEEAYARCASRASVPDFKATVVEEYVETVPIPGVPGERAEAVALVVRVEAGGQSDRLTLHLVDVDGAWRWLSADPAAAVDC